VKWLLLIPWTWFVACFAFAAAGLLLLGARTGTQPIDYQGYQHAVDGLNRGEGPYQRPEQCRQLWRGIHQAELFVVTGGKLGALPPAQPGPYLYPPTLALLIQRLHTGAPFFICLLLGAVIGFGWLWLRAAQASPWWLLLISGSWDALATFLAGNAELLLPFLTLAAAWLLWRRRGVWAAPLIALTVLIKPFYALFFVAFGLLLLVTDAPQRRAHFRALALAAAGALLLAALDIAAWGAPVRAAALDYFRHAMDYQWWTLPVAEQTPMSLWNRAPMQGLVLLGLPAATAQLATNVLWLALLAATLWRCRGRRLGFPLLFAIAFVLLYLGRPVGWGLRLSRHRAAGGAAARRAAAHLGSAAGRGHRAVADPLVGAGANGPRRLAELLHPADRPPAVGDLDRPPRLLAAVDGPGVPRGRGAEARGQLTTDRGQIEQE